MQSVTTSEQAYGYRCQGWRNLTGLEQNVGSKWGYQYGDSNTASLYLSDSDLTKRFRRIFNRFFDCETKPALCIQRCLSGISGLPDVFSKISTIFSWRLFLMISRNACSSSNILVVSSPTGNTVFSISSSPDNQNGPVLSEHVSTIARSLMPPYKLLSVSDFSSSLN